MKSQNRLTKPAKVMVVAVAFLGVLLACLYFVNYFKPLDFMRDTFEEMNITTVDSLNEYEFVERSVIKEMINRSKGVDGNPMFAEKYSKVLWLPLPYYPMSDYQRIELTLAASRDDWVQQACEIWRNGTIEVEGLGIIG